MRLTFIKLLDLPFFFIALLFILADLLTTVMFNLQFFPLWFVIPVVLLDIYVLILIVYWVYLFITSKRLRQEMEVFEVLQKKSLALCLSMELNILFSIYYFYVGIRYHSQWFGNIALFYIALSVARFIMLRSSRFENIPLLAQYKLYMKIGYLMLAMMMALWIMTMMVVNQNYSVSYPGFSFYIAFAFSIYLIISATAGMISQRKYKSPLLSGQQTISVSAALLGVLSIQTAVLSMISIDMELKKNLNLFTGIAIFLIQIILSLRIIYISAKKINSLFPN